VRTVAVWMGRCGGHGEENLTFPRFDGLQP
jgi:hypothetical protein